MNEEKKDDVSFHVQMVSTSSHQMALAYIRTNHPEDVVLFAVNSPELAQVLTGEDGSKIKPENSQFLRKINEDFERYNPDFFFFIVPTVENARFFRELLLEQLPQDLRDRIDLNFHICEKGKIIFV